LPEPEQDRTAKTLTTDDVVVLREALATRPEWFDLARSLVVADRARSSDDLRALAIGFNYDLVVREQRSGSASCYSAGWIDSTPVEDAPAELRAVWAAAIEVIPDPINGCGPRQSADRLVSADLRSRACAQGADESTTDRSAIGAELA
jgi:hypothetical protein